jgi:hypothetical protein
VSIDRKRWAQKAQELKFTQLDSARRQAEGWRTGLGGLTTLLSAVLIVKGRDNIAELTPAFRWGVVILLGTTLAMLVGATLLALRAASGRPGQDVLLSGESLRAWTVAEARKISVAIRHAAWLATLAIPCLAIAIGCTWLGPTSRSSAPLVEVHHDGGRACGELTGADRRQLILKVNKAARSVLIPLRTVIDISPVSACK